MCLTHLTRSSLRLARLQQKHARSMSSFPWSDYPAVKLHHQEVDPKSGDGGPVVICHGMLGNSGNWMVVARTVAEVTGRRVLLPDARNHGRSPHTDAHTYQHLASDLRRFLCDHDLRDATLIGHSMGARTVMLLCLVDDAGDANGGGRVREGISVDASPIHETPSHGVKTLQDYFTALKSVNLSKLDPKLTLSEARTRVGAFLKEHHFFAAVTKQWMLLNLDKEDGAFRWKFNLDAISDSLVEHMLIVPERDRWKPFEGDFMFIGGDLSGYIPRDCFQEVRRAAFPAARFAYVANAGHFVHIDQREQFLKTLLPELRTKRTVGGSGRRDDS